MTAAEALPHRPTPAVRAGMHATPGRDRGGGCYPAGSLNWPSLKFWCGRGLGAASGPKVCRLGLLPCCYLVWNSCGCPACT